MTTKDNGERHPLGTVWQTVAGALTKLNAASFALVLSTSLLLPLLTAPIVAHATGGITNTRGDAWGTLEVAGTDPSNLGGAGVDIYSNGAQVSYTPNKPNNTVNGVVSGEEWQCVELVNRLYLTKGWTAATWSGNGGQLYDTAPTGLNKELNGSITYLTPGDVLVLQDSSADHAAIINTFTGSTGAMQIESQNTNVVFDSTFSLSNKTISSTGWGTYSVKGVVHHPSTSNNFEAAFQAAGTGDQWVYGNAGTGDTGQGMLTGTSPSITQLSGGGFEAAFQNNTGNLWVYNSSTGPGDTGQGMLAGTSPSITASGSGYKAAFQANTGYLFTYDSSAGPANTGQGMMAGTSPSITALTGGGYEVAFEANNGDLWVYGSVAFGDTGLGMKAGTSPSITAYGSGGYEVAFQNNTGDLWLYGNAGTGDQQRGMLGGTSPTIVGLSGGGYQTAFQANTGNLWLYGTLASGDTGYGMAPGTSPSIALLASGGYEVAFQRATTGNLWTYGNAGTGDRGDGMAPGTSPSIAAQ